jgi:tetratricopeptide (TPR) repeat protein
LQPRVPRDLETICSTCLQKEAGRRYVSAEALARDLKHFLDSEPIEARPVSAVERVWRWCRRHPAVASLTAAVFALLATVAVTSSVLAFRIDREKKQTELERQAAVAAQALAQKNEELARDAEKKAQKNEEIARDAEKKAKENADKAIQQGGLALRALGTLIDKVQEQIGETPGMQPLKATLLTTALEGLDKVANSDDDKRLHGQFIAGAYMKMGNLFQQLGQSDKAYEQYLKCHEIIKSMAEKDWEGAEVARDNLASTFTVLGMMSRELKHDLRAAVGYYQQAFDIRRDLLSRGIKRPEKLDPTKLKGRFAESSTLVGVTYLLLGEPTRAAEFFDRARSIRQELVDAAPTDTPANVEAARSYRLDLARSYNALAEVHVRSRDWTAARADYAQALAINEAVHREQPANPKYRLELANTFGNQGMFEARAGRLDNAKKSSDRFYAITEELAGLDQKNADYQRAFGKANYQLGMLARRQHDADAAQKLDQKCLQIREQLSASNPKNERRRIELMLVLPRCGQHAGAAAEADKLLSGNPDREVLVEVAQCYAQCAAAVSGDPALRAAYTDKAIDALTRAIDQGYKDVVILETEPDLDGVRDDSRFQALLQRLGVK